MKPEDFKKLLTKISDLSHNQVEELKASLKRRSQSENIRNLETAFEELGCPSCGGRHIGHWGFRSGLKRYRCKDCGRTFNSLSGTPLAKLRKKEKWADYARGMQASESLQKSADRLDISKKTAFKWRHRFLEKPTQVKPEKLSGVVENDETFFLESEKGCRLGLERKARKRAGKADKPGLSDQQVYVFVSRDRNGNTYDSVLREFSSEILAKDFAPRLDDDIMFCSDGKSVYGKFARENELSHEALNLSKGEHVRNKIIHIQNVNAYHSRLKDWIRSFKGVATKYLDSYLAWFRAEEETNTQFSPAATTNCT